ncbi:UDP-glucosyltransferase 2-like [Danaus plexippus]|uniref:UDP-glucosyltransferase 2-like n=1 Tax=Danaus plexippus TaxID=13037 RepID=UPI002AB01E06|nr:UDP-glucosyltransferase 2-like [Danaus plexippus]
MQALLCLALCCATVHAASILAVLPTNTKSHYAMYGRLIEALAINGHNITVITHFAMKNPPPNVDEINLAGTIPDLANNLTKQQSTFKPDTIRNLENIIKECVHACDVVSQHAEVKALVNSSKTFDLVIVEVFGSECFLPFGKRFDAPVVGLLSSVPLPWLNDQLGNPEETAYVPAYMMGYGQHMNLFQRFINTVAVIWAKAFYRNKSQIPSQIIADRLFGPGPRLESLAQNYSLVLSNSHFSINEVRPLVPALVEVGGLHLDSTQQLPKELRNLLDNADEGIIYWSFGSMSRIETIPYVQLTQIFAALSELPQTVLVKMNKKMLQGNLTVPDNIYAMDWIPQYKTLCHPNVKLFISHGGLLGTQEAVACSVPILMVPLYADQALNARAMSDRGVARIVTLRDSTTEIWRDALRQLLTNTRYKQKAIELRDKFLDRPLPPLETGIYWIEYVIRHRGAHHLRSPALDLTYAQYHLLDVAALIIAITATITYILHKLFRYLCTRCVRWCEKHTVIEKRLFIRNSSLFQCFLWLYKVKPN